MALSKNPKPIKGSALWKNTRTKKRGVQCFKYFKLPFAIISNNMALFVIYPNKGSTVLKIPGTPLCFYK